MDFQELIKKRQSNRAYRPDPVEEADLRRILEAARLAPTAANKQPFRLVVLKTSERKADVQRIYHAPWFSEAPIVIGVIGVPAEGWIRKDGKNHTDIDAAIVMDHIILAATELGYGTCWVCNFDPVATREALRLPEGFEPIAFTPIGRPADTPREKTRKPLADLLMEV